MIDKKYYNKLENLVFAYENGEDLSEYSETYLDRIEKESFGLEEIELHQFEKEMIDFCESFVGQEVSKDKSKNTFNCSAFVRYIYNKLLGIDISQNGYGGGLTARIMTSNIGKNLLIDESVDKHSKIEFIRNNANIGDILLFHRQALNDNITTPTNYYPGHVGLYLGNDKYIDARSNRGNIDIVDISNDNYLDCFVGIKTILRNLVYEKDDVFFMN